MSRRHLARLQTQSQRLVHENKTSKYVTVTESREEMHGGRVQMLKPAVFAGMAAVEEADRVSECPNDYVSTMTSDDNNSTTP